MELFWKKKARQKEEVKQAQDLLAYYKKALADAQAEQENKSRRQVELWAVGSLSEDLTAEYRNVTSGVAYFAKAQLAIKEYIKKLDIELYHCQFGQCDGLAPLLSVNPLADVSDTVPVVDFKNKTVH